MPTFSVGDLVWVRLGTGDHEEPATIIGTDCLTQENKKGLKCKLQVSLHENVYDFCAVRHFEEGRSRRRCRSSLSPDVSRSVVTPSPVAGGNKEVDKNSIKATTPKRRKLNERTSSPHFKSSKGKPSEKGKTSSQKKSVKQEDEVGAKKKQSRRRRKGPELIVSRESDSSEGEPLASLMASRRNGGKPKKLRKSLGGAKSAEGTESQKGPEAKADSDDEDSENEIDRPFKIEYSPTGRATCRRCDELIEKGALRVSHVPLFRGKPGFTVYRHLKCAVFSEEIKKAEDVGGWKKISAEDYKALVQRVEESKEEVRKENEELDPDELVPVVFKGETRSVPPGLAANLLPFQVEGASWMYHQETNIESGIRGGILADEMGMGKTLQTIVAILDNRPRLQHSQLGAKHPIEEKEIRQAEEDLWSKSFSEWKHEMEKNDVPKSIQPKATKKKAGGGARAGTLVICPLIALTQWKSEIEKFTFAETLKVGIYHGPDRESKMPRELMCKYDVVLTTYQVLEADFRKMTSPNKIKCPNCGGKFKIDKLRIHLKYFCGEGAQRTEAQARQRRSRESDNRSPTVNNSSRKKKRFKHSTSQKKNEKKKRLSKIGDYASESELSELDEVVPATKGRTSRRAALNASKRMSKSKKEWSHFKNDDESDGDSDFDNDTSSDESEGTISTPKTKTTTLSDSTSDDDGDDNIARARKRQQEEMDRIQSKGTKAKKDKKKPMRKKFSKMKSRRGAPKRQESEDDESPDEANDNDPMEGIDMDALMKEAMSGCRMSALHSFCWWRIVLDEAHMIKSRSSQTAGAAFALISAHRWCLSGTPLQNRVGEFYSLIRFLRIDPMAHYFCKAKGCNCKSLHYRMMNGKCQDCGHGSVQHYSHFNKHVLNPIQRSGYSGDGRRAMFKLKKEILDNSLLRRTKENRAADMKLPPRIVTIRSVRLHPIEEDFYTALYTQTKSSFNDYIEEGTLLNNYAHIFDLLMRMRQAVDHPYLVIYSKKDIKAVGSNGLPVSNGSSDCVICHEPPTDGIVSSCCETQLCRSCVIDYMALSRGENTIPCPGCRAPFSIDLNQSVASTEDSPAKQREKSSDSMPSLRELPNVATGSILRRINLAEFATSSKIEALIEELVSMRKTSPGSKAIVFSQFVNMLDLIRWRLHSDPCLEEMGLGARALHGGMNVKARDASLKDFKEDPNARVLLISLKAGGVALNLTVANHIYLMDPWWNPAAEFQAIDRTHRLGQYRPIRAVRFVSEDTVEERILQLQEKKRLVFDGTIGRDAGSLKQLTVDDMKSLFT